MAFDGFIDAHKEAYGGYSASGAERLCRALDAIGRHLDVRVEGLDNLPRGRGLLVANHAFGFVDIALAMARIHALTGRRIWALGEHAWWQVPGIRRLAAIYGTVDGTQENVDRLLAHDELVLVLPGGLRESMKPRELRYRLLWGHRYGFVRAARRHAAPIVPVASLGADDAFDLVGDAFARGRRLHLPFPLPRPAHMVPIMHLRKMKVVIGESIPTDAVDPDEEHALRRIRREVEGSLHEIFETELTRRAHFCTSNHEAKRSQP